MVLIVWHGMVWCDFLSLLYTQALRLVRSVLRLAFASILNQHSSHQTVSPSWPQYSRLRNAVVRPMGLDCIGTYGLD